MIKVKYTNSNFERNPLAAPFGFKGGYTTEIWQSVAYLEADSGCFGCGLGSQSPLWSDASVFSSCSEAAGNGSMFLMTEYALRAAREISFASPFDLLDRLLPITHKYGKKITSNPDLRLTFTLNSLVALDNAAWQLYCRTNGINGFDEMLPPEFRPAFRTRHQNLALIPLISYGVTEEAMAAMIDQGLFFLKIKIGADPDGDGDPAKMLEWDKQRLSAVHRIAGTKETPWSETGRIPYYLDANGRYDGKDRLLRLLEHAEKIGALEQIILLEEPFPEEYKADVSDIPVRLAADESAHSDADALERIDMGYRAIALKPIAKTMSMSLRIAKLAFERDIPCFCADLTVNPILVEWNKTVASRLKALPGMLVGAMETNGHQNYADWDIMKTYHPHPDAPWSEARSGMFHLGPDFYETSGGILADSAHYLSIVKPH